MPDTAAERAFSQLVDHCLRLRPAKHEQQRALPILLLWGPRMSGKSRLLEGIHERFYHDRPYVRRNKNELGTLRPHEVALQLAFHLGCRVEGFGRLKFPRLFLGVAAIRGPVNIEDPAATRSMMIRRVVPDRKRLRKLARETAIGMADIVGAGQGMRFFLGLAVEGAGAIAETALALSGRGKRWYQDGLGQHFADPIDALVRLAEQEAVPQSRERVDEVLCRAFLADLRDEYSSHPLQIYAKDENCLAILDDADSAGARGFLDILVAQRREWDPLLIVSAAATRSPSIGHQHPENWVVRDAAEVSYQDWIDGRNSNDEWAALYPTQLSGHTLDEARDHFTGDTPPPHGPKIDVAGILGDAEKALRFAHRLTSGHPGGMRLVLAAMSLERQRVGAEHVDVCAVCSANRSSRTARHRWLRRSGGCSSEAGRYRCTGRSCAVRRPGTSGSARSLRC